MAELTSLCVYCGSQLGNDPAYRELAQNLGTRLAATRVRLIFGGGRIGLMGVVADAVLAAGGTAIGVIPQHLSRAENAHSELSEIHVVDSMHTRKQKMFDLADAFAVLPGGLGTLDETIEVLTWKQLGLHDKPIVILNQSEYWQPLEALIQHTIAASFTGSGSARLYSLVSTMDGLFAAIADAPSPMVAAGSERL
jgi:uncharacterized protein (TIGR00730 family)